MTRVLTAYFSAGGVTAKVARRLADAVQSDLYEIVPEQPYTRADLNWMNKKSRSSLEMKDRSSRPAIAGKLADMNNYDVIFVGFPIWWYREPSIIDTFMESYDFSGKTVIPFATSGGSGMGDTSGNLQALAKHAEVEEGRRFDRRVSAEELKEWGSRWL